MSKKDETSLILVLLALGAILYPFIWVYENWGGVSLLVILLLIAVGIYYLRKVVVDSDNALKHEEYKRRSVSAEKENTKTVVVSREEIDITDDHYVSVELRINKIGEDYFKLHREATAQKDAGNWDKAIDSLYKAKEINEKTDFHITAQSLCKLPLYLQKAGRFEESMQEFEYLFSTLEVRAKKEAGIGDRSCGRSPNDKQRYKKAVIEDSQKVYTSKMNLAKKREAKTKR